MKGHTTKDTHGAAIDAKQRSMAVHYNPRRDYPRGRNAAKRAEALAARSWRHATINDGQTEADHKTIEAAMQKRARKAARRLAGGIQCRSEA